VVVRTHSIVAEPSGDLSSMVGGLAEARKASFAERVMADWRDELAEVYKTKDRTQATEQVQLAEMQKAVTEWFRSVAAPAYDELRTELEKYGRTVDVDISGTRAAITVNHGNTLEIAHYLDARISPRGNYIKLSGRQLDETGKPYGWESQVRSSSQECGIESLNKSHLIAKFMEDYKRVVK
jgi:hypothetical protein